MLRTSLLLAALALACGPIENAPDRPDGGPDVAPPDAGEAPDAGESPDAGWGPCTVEGVPGTCGDFARCETNVTRPGFCPGPARVQCCLEREPATPRCPESRTPRVNEGFETEPPGLGGCPAGMARVDAFCIDRWEAAIAGASPYESPGIQGSRAISVPDAYPQAYVSQLAAAAACANAGKRLCTDAEWLRACRGPGGNAYPYGPDRIDGACHDESARTEHPAVACFRSAGSSVFSHLDDPGIDQAPDALAAAGSHPACVTGEGVYDLMGNLHEWTADPAGTFRGGFFADTKLNGNGCAYATTAHDTAYSDYSTGFRCCADPP